MKLDLNEIAANVGKKISYELNEPAIKIIDNDDCQCDKPITGRFSFSNTGSAIIVRGSFKAEVLVECARCLKSFCYNIEQDIDELLPLVGGKDEIEEQLGELPGDDKEPLFEYNIFNLGEYLRQAIISALPIKPLCSEDCKGLCSICGSELDSEDCKCKEESVNPAFAKLEFLLKEENSEDG
ncbi:MAG: DUF177 domain-containing protein [Armatimonadota bacterium]